MNRAERTAAQIAHIREHQERFDGHAGPGDVAEYFADHGDKYWDLYERLCGDLGIEPRPGIGHPDPSL